MSVLDLPGGFVTTGPAHSLTVTGDLLPTAGPDHTTPAPRTPGDLARRVAAIVALTGIVTICVGAMLFAASGGRWFVIRTPSMGTYAPVGTLVLTRPTSVADLRVGDVVAFHPSTVPDETYTHRVVAVTGDHVTTRGDINGAADPWATTDHDIIGRAVVVLPGVGFLLRAVPLFVLGGLLLTSLSHWWIRPAWRGPARLLGSTVLYLVAALVIRPWVGVVQLASSSAGDHVAIETASTGLLPIQVVPLPGKGTAAPLDLGYGDHGVITLSNPPADGKYQLTAHLHLPWTGWLLLGLVSALPLLWVLLVGFRRPPYDDGFSVGIGDDDTAVNVA